MQIEHGAQCPALSCASTGCHPGTGGRSPHCSKRQPVRVGKGKIPSNSFSLPEAVLCNEWANFCESFGQQGALRSLGRKPIILRWLLRTKKSS